MSSKWLDVVSRITPKRSKEIDSLLGLEPLKRSGQDLSTCEAGATTKDVAPSSRFWTVGSLNATHIGVRVTEIDFNFADIALQLASAASERGVVPVIFSYVPVSNFEQYGFRVERVPSDLKAVSDVFEAELCAFWAISLVIDVGDVRSLV